MGWNGSSTSGISTFCCKCDRLSSSSVHLFLVTGMPVFASTSARPPGPVGHLLVLGARVKVRRQPVVEVEL